MVTRSLKAPNPGRRTANGERSVEVPARASQNIPPSREDGASRTARRDYIAESAFNTGALTNYGRYLIDQSEGTAAEEVLSLSLASNGAQVEALELYQDLCRELDLPDLRWHWALSKLSRDIASVENEHRGALDFAIPYRLQPVFTAVERGTDSVSKAIVAVDRAYENEATFEEEFHEATDSLGDNDTRRVLLTVLLGRRDYDTALKLLRKSDPAGIPKNALRRALRRARAEGNIEDAISCAEAYKELIPDDNWTAALMEKLREEATSNKRLAIRGFPFPDPVASPEYEPRPLRVLYAVHNSLPYHATGYATRTHGMLYALNKIGWQVDAVTRLGYPYDLPEYSAVERNRTDRVDDIVYRRLWRDGEIERKNPLLAYTTRYADALQNLSIEQRPALIHAASNHLNGLAAVSACRRIGIPSVYEVRGLWEITRASREPQFRRSASYEFAARMEADAAKAATRVITLTEALRQEMIARGVAAENISVVPNGVDVNRFTPKPKDHALVSSMGLNGKTVIGYVGSVLDYEGLDLLLDAAIVLRRTREDFHVLIVGDGSALERLRSYATQNGLDSFVTFTGRVDHSEVERYYSIIDIAPFPRRAVPVCELVSPLKPFEAMSMAKAVIASNVAALSEFVEPGVNGLVHEKEDVESLSRNLEHLLDHPKYAQQLGIDARSWVVGHRDWRILAKQIASVYKDVLRDR